jgi:hypothetical protein
MAVIFGPTQWQYNICNPPPPELGCAYEGGYLIFKSGGTAWIVAPNTTEVSRNWDGRNDAVTTAQANAACGDWFLPSIGQLFSPGYTCRTYWDSYSSTYYWSSTSLNGRTCFLNFNNGAAHNGFNFNDIYSARAFRCVTY